MQVQRSPFTTLTLIVVLLSLLVLIRENRTRATQLRTAAEQLETLEQRMAGLVLPGAGCGAGGDLAAAAQIYKRVSPSVVSVANHALVRRGFFSFQLYEVPRGAGSGFVWDKKGHIVSNYHVVHQASKVIVTFPDGTRYNAEIVGVAADYDLAVLKIDVAPELLHPVELALSRELEVGQPVFAIGNPFGLDTTLSAGIVSALGRSITSMTERRIADVIQTDAAINPGNSGGPLLDIDGRVAGINTAIVSPSGAYAGVGFAVPADTVSRVVPQLIARGYVTRAGLGVEFLPDHVTTRSGVKGVAVLMVYENTPAARAGMEGMAVNHYGTLIFGDVIVAINQQELHSVEELRTALDICQPGERVNLTLLRAGQQRVVEVELIEEK